MDGVSETAGRPALPLRWLLLAALAGLVLRLAFGFGYWTGQPLTRDEQEYLSLARSLALGRGFTYDDTLTNASRDTFGRAPGYPWFVSLVHRGDGTATGVPASVKAAQAVVGAIGVLLVGAVACRLAGRRAALAAAGIAAVYPPLVWVAGYALSEAIFWPVALGAVVLFDRTNERGSPTFAFVCGLACAGAMLIRPSMIFFVPLAAGALGVRRRWLASAMLLAGVAVALAPWVVRNHAVHGRVILAASTGGVNFWIGNHPLAVGDGDMAANPAIKLDNARLRDAHPGLTEEAMEPVYYREALRWIAAHPARWLGLELRKAFYLVVPTGPSYTLHSARYQVASIAPYLLVSTLAALVLLRRSLVLQRTTGLWLLVASAVVSALVFFPQERFRIPVIDPALVILAGTWFGSRGTRPPAAVELR